MAAPHPPVRDGGCACGAVRFRAQGDPLRAGLCHCRVCQQVHGSAFYAFAVFDAARVQFTGKMLPWQNTPRYTRLACAACGSRLGGTSGSDIELALLSFDTAAGIEPQYESWVCRRVPWLPALPVAQYDRDRAALP